MNDDWVHVGNNREFIKFIAEVKMSSNLFAPNPYTHFIKREEPKIGLLLSF
jgi:hypothetical protein